MEYQIQSASVLHHFSSPSNQDTPRLNRSVLIRIVLDHFGGRKIIGQKRSYIYSFQHKILFLDLDRKSLTNFLFKFNEFDELKKKMNVVVICFFLYFM